MAIKRKNTNMTRLYDKNGQRKYLNAQERERFLQAAAAQPPSLRLLCETLLWTGCRISEALALTARHIDMQEQGIVIASLKKRRTGVYRVVPVPDAFLLRLHHWIHENNLQQRLWPCDRTTAWRQVKMVMHQAGITNSNIATPRGLRHGFGVNAVRAGVPLNIVQRWLGHARLSTTSIYTDIVGTEERAMAALTWAA